jgi:hypothetical protein
MGQGLDVGQREGSGFRVQGMGGRGFTQRREGAERGVAGGGWREEKGRRGIRDLRFERRGAGDGWREEKVRREI